MFALHRPRAFPLYLCRRVHRDRLGNTVRVAERCLVPRDPGDLVLAVVLAPPGTRIRQRPDPNGPDQLDVPLDPTLLGRLFGPRRVVPAKYLLGDAHCGRYGLSVAPAQAGGTIP
jgi:hypothetical protein